jgi:MFS transporter, PPP family, 3-phenylpropionic acid transporter
VTVLISVVRHHSTPRSIGIALYVSVFAAIGAAPPYLPLYYESLGLSLGAIGLLAAVAAISGLLAAPAWGVAADQVVGSRAVLVAASLASAGCAIGLALANQPSVAILMAVLYALSFAGIGPVLDAYALLLVAENQHRYARLRVWGSASFVVSTVAVGILIGQTELRSLFIVLVGALLVTVAVSALLPVRAHIRPQRRLSGLRAVLRNSNVVTFVAAALVAWSASTMVNGFLSIYLTSLQAPAALVGSAWALGAVVEVPTMIAFPALAARFGLERLIVLGAGLLLLRVVVLVLTAEPLVVILSMALHGGGYALLLVGGVTYVARHAPAGSGATAQGVLSGVVFGLAQAIGPGVAGLIAGATSIQTMFWFAMGASAVGVVVVYAALARAHNPVVATG